MAAVDGRSAGRAPEQADPAAVDAPAAAGAAGERAWEKPDARRVMQLVLATFWLLDGILQLQAFFFTKSFGLQMISGESSGNPPAIARPIDWSATVIGHHAVATDAIFALIQIVIAFAIAWRRTVRVGLAISIVWALGVWWIGEGLGGVLNGTADPANGAPGAVILYALAAVLLWPGNRSATPAPFVAARWVGEPVAKALWAVLWGSLAYFAVIGPNRSPRHLHLLIGDEANGEPPWLAVLDHHVASAVDHHGLVVSTVCAVVFLGVALGIFLPGMFPSVTLVVAAAMGLLLWTVGQNFGELFTNGATDLDTGPLLVLLAAMYWRGPVIASTHRADAVDRRLALEAA